MANPSEQLNQDEIEELLRKNAASKGPSNPPKAPAAAVENTPSPHGASLDPSELEALIQASSTASATASMDPSNQGSAHSPTQTSQASRDIPSTGNGISQNDIDYLLNKAEAALASIDSNHSELPGGIRTFQLEEFSGTPASTEVATLDLMRDIELDVHIELGRTHMCLEEVLKLNKGAVVPLDKLAGDPVDIYVNGRLIARGEVLVLNDNFCVRVAELIVGDSACAI
ncbi:MAG: flagellar motor switch protein FliN [Pirellulales bacterium]|nr:flagellar motor switch protein FliN [Pirellulales bacterium]